MIRIVTDSTCDLTRREQEELGIDVIPLTINFDGRIYKDGVDLTQEQFYAKLEKVSKLPTTSQINPGEFGQYFQSCLDSGDDVVGIFLSSGLSGTYQSAVIAANEVGPDRIFPVDSRSFSFGTALLIREAVRMRNDGQYKAADIAKAIALLSRRLKLYAVVDTLKYLKMGGRLDAKTAFVGELLGIKPVAEVVDGKIEIVGKVRGDSAFIKALYKKFQEVPPDFRYGFAFGHSNCPEKLEACRKFFAPYLETDQIICCNVGSVVGTHTGPGDVAIAYIQAATDG